MVLGRKFGFHSGTVTCRDAKVLGDLYIQDDIVFSDVSAGRINVTGGIDLSRTTGVDSNLILGGYGRVSTGSVAGSALILDSSYTQKEAWELRYTVSNWTGIADSFKGYYLRAEATAGNNSYGLRGMELYGVANITSGTTGLNNVQGLYVEQQLRHGAASWTLGGGNAIEANISIYAGAGTLTLGNDICCIYAKVQGANGLHADSYAKVDGIKISCRDADSASRVFGTALSIEDPEPFVSSWTTGIDIKTICIQGINIGTCTTGINVAANIVMPQLLTVGTSADPVHWDGVASNILIYQEATPTAMSSVTANKFVLDATHSGATTSGRLEGFRQVVRSYSTNAVTADLRGIVGQMEFSGIMTYASATSADFSGCYAVIASIWSGSNVTASNGRLYPLGIFFGLETGTTLSGEDSYIYIYNYGKVCPNSVIKLYNASTPENPVYLFDHQGASLGSASGPIYIGDVDPTGTTSDDALGADGHIKILIGATPYYIPIFGTLVV